MYLWRIYVLQIDTDDIVRIRTSTELADMFITSESVVQSIFGETRNSIISDRYIRTEKHIYRTELGKTEHFSDVCRGVIWCKSVQQNYQNNFRTLGRLIQQNYGSRMIADQQQKKIRAEMAIRTILQNSK